jgi:peptide/nickel transport system substrate-binding protein
MMKCWKTAVLGVTFVLLSCGQESLRTAPSNSVRIPILFDPVSFDPANNTGSFDGALLDLMYQQLTAVDPQSSNGAIVGELAESWSVSPDGNAWTFVLRDGARFEDNSPVTAAAVKYSFDRIRRVSASGRSRLFWLRSVDVVDPRTVRFNMAVPFAAVPTYLALPAYSIVNPSTVQAHAQAGDDGAAWLSENSAGSGTYRIARWRRGQDLTLEQNPAAQRRPRQFTNVIFSVVPTDATRRLQLQNGDVDVVPGLGAASVAQYQAIPDVTVARAEFTMDMRFLTINTQRPAAHAIDYQALQRNVLAGNVALINGYLPPNVPGGNRDLPAPRRDLNRARQLLREAGYDTSNQLRLVVAAIGPVAEFLQSQLRDAGITVRLQRLAPSAIDAIRSSGDFDLYYDGWVMDVPDPSIFFNLAFSSRYTGSGINASRFSTPEIDAALDRALADLNPDRRAALYRTIERHLIDARPVVMLYATLPITAHRSDIVGLRMNPYQTTYMNIAEWTRR